MKYRNLKSGVKRRWRRREKHSRLHQGYTPHRSRKETADEEETISALQIQVETCWDSCHGWVGVARKRLRRVGFIRGQKVWEWDTNSIDSPIYFRPAGWLFVAKSLGLLGAEEVFV
jgi:hypothetical protein